MEKKSEQESAGQCSSSCQKHSKGILKNKETFLSPSSTEDHVDRIKSQRWDEMNILATYHPAEKDYGFIKINEPDTPFLRLMDDETEEGTSSKMSFQGEEYITPEALAERFAAMDGIPAKIFQSEESYSKTSFEEEDLSPEAKEDALQFLKKRKAHYDEGKYLRMKWENLQDEDNNEAEEGTMNLPLKHTKKKDSRGECSRMSDAFKKEIHLHYVLKLMAQEKRQEPPPRKEWAFLTHVLLEPAYLNAGIPFKVSSSPSKMGWYNWFRTKSESLKKKAEKDGSSGLFRNTAETEEEQQLGKQDWNDEEQSNEKIGPGRQKGGQAPRRGL